MSPMTPNDPNLPPTLTVSATEVNVSHFHQQPSATQSNEELLAGDTYIEPNGDSESVCTTSTLASLERPVSLVDENAVNLPAASVSVPAISPPPIRVELSPGLERSRTSLEDVPTTSNNKHNARQSTSPPNLDILLQVPSSSRPGVLEDDIELADFAITSSGTGSTDQLVPVPVDEPQPIDRPESQVHPQNTGTPDRVDPEQAHARPVEVMVD